MVFFLCFERIFAHLFLLLLNFFVFALVVVCEVGKGFGDDVRTAGRIGVSIRVDRLDGDMGIRILGLIIVQVVHDEVTILLADEPVGYRFAVLVVITRGKGILSLAADAVHGILSAVFDGIYLPTAVGIEHIGYQYILFDGRFQSSAYDS